MKITLSTNEVADRLNEVEAFGNEEDSYSLCYSMAEWLEQLEEDTGQEMELDPIAIRCEFSIIKLSHVADTYDIGDAHPLDYLNDNTLVIETAFDGWYIFQDF